MESFNVLLLFLKWKLKVVVVVVSNKKIVVLVLLDEDVKVVKEIMMFEGLGLMDWLV